MLRAFVAKHGIPKLNSAGPIVSILEAAGDSDFRSVQDVFQALDAVDLDVASGTSLAAWGAREGVPQGPLAASSGTVTIGDSSFQKIASPIFAGTPAPIAGATSVNVVDASGMPPSGAVYLGRGTSRYEGPIAYVSRTDNGTYWTLTFSSPTIRFHNQGEVVILAQGGDRKAQAGAVVRVPRSSLADAVDFRLVFAAVVPDGEVELSGVQVAAVQPGGQGNAPEGAVREWASLPWAGATVANPLKFNNGQDVESEDSWRERIRHARANRATGIAPALEAAAVGVVSPDEGRRVLSAAYVARENAPSSLVIDDGTGYEEITAGVAVERLLESTSGGELDLALQSTPVTKAFLRAVTEAPYAVVQGSQLVLLVGGVPSAHVFDTSAFADGNSATAFEVASSINADPTLLYQARTVDQGTSFVVLARDEADDDVEVSAPPAGEDANDAFGLPAGAQHTLLLYRDDRPLSKDGRAASVTGEAISLWSTIAGPQTLQVAVDGTPATTYAIVDQDFVNAGTGFLSVGRNSPAAWAAVLQARLPGLAATTDGTRITLTSNRGTSSLAAVRVTGGTLVDNRMFDLASSAGLSRDYTLNRARGLVRLAAPASPGNVFSAGTSSPRAFLESPDLGVVSLPSGAHVWAAPEADGSIVAHGVTASTPIGLTVEAVSDWGCRLRLEAFPGATPTVGIFDDVRAGDWAVLWDAALPAAVRGGWRVADVALSFGFSTRLILERRVTRAARAGHAASTMVPVGANASKVLVTGGWLAPTSLASVPAAVTDSAELYDHQALAWATAAPMRSPRAYHTATTLQDGRVLVVGGLDQAEAAQATAELYDPTTDTWSAAAAYQVAVARHRAILLQDGRVLVSGGVSGGTYRTQSAIYTPGTNTWTANVPMATARARFGLALLADGRVLAAGGETTGAVATATAELLNPAVPAWSAAASMPTSRRGHGVAGVGAPVTTVLAVGDDAGGPRAGTFVVYNVAGNTWGADAALPGGSLFEAKDAISLQDGTVLAPFGRAGTSPVHQAWDGASWTALAAPAYADSPSRQEVALALLRNNAATLVGKILTVGGLDPTRVQPTAGAELYDRTANAWTLPDAAATTGLTLSQIGLSICRTDQFLQNLTVPAGAGYTATSLADALDGAGITTETFRTNRVRIRTNRHGLDGDVLVAASDQAALGLVPGKQENEAASTASVEGGPGLGTPDFVPTRILEEARAPGVGVAALVRVNRTASQTTWGGGHALVVARAHDDGAPSAPHPRQGRSRGFSTTAATLAGEPQATKLGLRATPDGSLCPGDRVWAASPYAIGPQDDLGVLVDDDATTKLFPLPLFRRCVPSGAYGTQVILNDADAGGLSLAASFGLGLDLADFAVYMRARTPLYATNPAQALMARYYLHGPAGERARVKVAYSLAPNSSVSVDFDATSQGTTDIKLRLPGGAARNLSGVRASTRVGTAVVSVASGLGGVAYVANLPVASAVRDGANLTTLTLTLPPVGVVDHGLVVGDILYLNSSHPSWTPGNFTVSARTATTVSFTNTLLGVGAAGPAAGIGTVSADAQGEATFLGAGVLVNDMVRAEAASGLPADLKGETFRVSIPATAGTIVAIASEKTFVATSTTLTWSLLGAAAYLRAWAPNSPTAAAFATAVNALPGPCPVTLAPLGAGTDLLTQSTVDFAANAAAWPQLRDGRNFVSRTVFPGSVGTPYQVVLKLPVDATLASVGGWASEDVRLVPVTPRAIVSWASQPAVSGLFTAAETAATEGGRNVQVATLTSGSAGTVRVQGGVGNAASALVQGAALDQGTETVVRIPASAAPGLQACGWAEARNGIAAERLGVLTSSSVLQSWDAAGFLTLSAAPLWTQRFISPNGRIHVERQGRYLALSDPAGGNADGAVTLANLQEGDYLSIEAAGAPSSFLQASLGNLGIFRVVRVAPSGMVGVAGTVWIENDRGVEETAEMSLRGIAFDSVMPGDVLTISHDGWGAENRGAWTVEAVGVAPGTTSPQFQNTVVLKVSVAERAPAVVTSPAPALGTNAGLTVVSEGAPGKMLKRVVTICPDPADGTLALVRLDSAVLSRLVSALRATDLVAQDKLAFSTDRVVGTDGYRASVGLVGAVNRVIQGDPADKIAFPGVVSAGPKVFVQAPTLRRLAFSLLVRAVTGFAQDDLTSRVQEAVVAEVNRVGVGQAVPLSLVVRAATSVQGVVGVTVLSPAYDATHDIVSVARDEKALILRPEDVTVTYTSD